MSIYFVHVVYSMRFLFCIFDVQYRTFTLSIMSYIKLLFTNFGSK